METAKRARVAVGELKMKPQGEKTELYSSTSYSHILVRVKVFPLPRLVNLKENSFDGRCTLWEGRAGVVSLVRDGH